MSESTEWEKLDTATVDAKTLATDGSISVCIRWECNVSFVPTTSISPEEPDHTK